MSQKEYTVRWEIEVSADTPEEAVRSVFEDFFRQGTDATVFDVKEHGAEDDQFQMLDAADLEEL